MSINIRFTEDDWQRIERDWQAWWAGELDRALIVLETGDPVNNADWSQLTRFGTDSPIDPILENWERILSAGRWHGDAFPKWWVNFGPGIMAGFFGAKVNWSPDTTWFGPMEGIGSLSEIQLTYNAQNPWWLRVLNITRQAVARWGNKVVMGTTDIGGNLDTLASLRGSEKLLFDVIDCPDQVERLAGQITPLWIRYYDELYPLTAATKRGNACWGPCWSPGKGYMLQCDFSYMISPDMFARFVLPDLTACCQHLDYAFYHLDGKGEIPHLDHLLSIKRLRGIQWQPGDGQPLGDGWPALLKRIRDGKKLCQVYVTCAGALKIKKELGGRGFLMHIIDNKLTPAQADDFVKEMSRK